MKVLTERIAMDQLLKASEMLKVAAHPQRLAILDLLCSGKRYNNSEIQELLDIDQATLSHHLTLMRNKGLLDMEREGKFAHYYIVYEDFQRIIACLENCCKKF